MKTLLSIILFLFSLNTYAQISVTLKGTIIGRDSKRIFIIPATTSFRTENKPVINIADNRFEYKLETKNLEAYELIFEDELALGIFTSIIVFPDTNVIELTLNTEDKYRQNIIKGGQLNSAYYHYKNLEKSNFEKKAIELNKDRKSLWEAGNYYTKERDSLIRLLGKSISPQLDLIKQQLSELKKTGTEFTPQATQLVARNDSLNKSILKWRYANIQKNINVANYFLMLQDVQYRIKGNNYLTMLVDEVFKDYAKKFPYHIYTKVIGDALSGVLKIFPGNPFIDFSAPNLNGKQFTISEEIKGKIALLNLWGSWCGPCIFKAQQVVPIYKKYKDKGFTVVGVAREFKNTDALVNRLKTEQFSWLNLVEMNDKNDIWNKYSISSGAGIQVLVDKSGTILAINPSADELEKIVSKMTK